MVNIVWNGKEYSYKVHTLKMACIMLAGELGFRKEWAYGTEIYKELSKTPTKGYWYCHEENDAVQYKGVAR